MRRREDGYHDLESLFVPVPLCDELEITPAECFSFIQSGIAVGGGAEDNIVVKAVRLMQRVSADSRVGNVAIRLHKNIPFGAGLGGGSSDGAFTLRMLNELFDLGFDSQGLRAMAAQLGADCPFFIDNRTAYVTGIGDRISPLGFNPLEGYKLVMIKPDETVSTAEAYRGITPREQRADIKPCLLTEAIRRPVAEWKETIFNDFEVNVFGTHPQLETIKRTLYAHGALYAAMSGSGSTVYGIFDHEAQTESIINPQYTTYTFEL